jgi:putative DNA primase/helicase
MTDELGLKIEQVDASSLKEQVKVYFIQDFNEYKKGTIILFDNADAKYIIAKGFGRLATEEDDKNFILRQKRSDEKIHKEVEQITENFKKAINLFIDKRDLAKQFMLIQPIHYDKNKVWWLWNKEECKWVLTDETDMLNLVESVSSANTISTKDRVEIIESLKQVGRRLKPKQIEKTWIQFKDTIIDWKNNNQFKATPEYFVTNPLPYTLDINGSEDTPIIDKIFIEWVGESHKKTLYEILAYCMLMDYPLNKIFAFVGAGSNGKTTYLKLLRKFIGENNVCSTELDRLTSSRFELVKLHKKLVCQMGETNFSTLSNTALLKNLSGGDLIGFEYKGSKLFDDYNYAKILISTNNLPETNDKTIGFFRRCLIVDFPNQFSEKRDILGDIPEEEYINLTLKCYKLLKDLLTNREFTNEGTIEDRQKRYEDRSNPFDKFFTECVKEDTSSCIPKWEFAKKLNEWCKSNRFREMTEITINKKMKDKNIFDDLIRVDNNSDKRWKVWRYIEWK